jgi:hypothetical protein
LDYLNVTSTTVLLMAVYALLATKDLFTLFHYSLDHLHAKLGLCLPHEYRFTDIKKCISVIVPLLHLACHVAELVECDL